MYGTVAAAKQAKAAHARYIPLPYDTMIPDIMPPSSWEISQVLTPSHFLTIDVQMAAPMRMNSAAIIDEAVEIKNSMALLATPL